MKCLSCASEFSQANNYCNRCGTRLAKSEFEFIVMSYLRKGYTYEEIRLCLNKDYGINICLRTLKKKLKELNLCKRAMYKDRIILNRVRTTISMEIQGTASLMGYRSMWHHLRLNHGIYVSRDHIMHAMQEISPEGVEARKSRKLTRRKYFSRGPNDCWHADGYDKLKPFGFPIHACIDGHSRRILWLELVRSNNDPYIVASLYLKTVSSIGIPNRIRTDCGSENGILAAAQCFLRRNDSDRYAGNAAHLYGSSHANQRIEAWWSQLRHSNTSYMIDFFKGMVEHGYYNPDNQIHKSIFWYCFSPIVKKELTKVKEHWNSHYIRRSAHSKVYGRPDQMFFHPKYPFLDQIHLVNTNDIEVIKETVEENLPIDLEPSVYDEYTDYLANALGIELTYKFK